MGWTAIGELNPSSGIRNQRQLVGRSPTNSAIFTPWSAASISAAFSPIMIDAAFVLPLTTFGMTLASALDPQHPEPWIHDAPDPAGRRDVVDSE